MRDVSELFKGQKDLESLKTLIHLAQELAIARDHPQLCSISLSVPYTEPLAVLDSVFDKNVPQFYIENTALKESHAAAEAIIQKTDLHTKHRFIETQKWINEWKDNCVCVSDPNLFLNGPVFFSGFPFTEESSDDKAYVFVPRWHVSRKGNKYVAIANFLIDENTDTNQYAHFLWSLHEKFITYDYSSLSKESDGPEIELEPREEFGNSTSYKKWVQEGIHNIQNSKLDKIVLARCKTYKTHSLQLVLLLNRLRHQFKECYTFAFSPGEGKFFIGATPERLAMTEFGKLKTVAIAGSAPRGKTVSSDARLSHELLKSSKDLSEHTYVIDSIRRRLKKLGIEIKAQDTPHLLQLANVQHLQTFIEADIKEASILEIIDVLHPTAAVGGIPNQLAKEKIATIENWDRGYYAGPIGWLDTQGNGEFVVGIRSMKIYKNQVSVFAGAGIVNASNPEKEFTETELKFEAILKALGI